eukprot:CAMPEP_0203902666 /NCGR_PEP_ID=MMETSP0359-20131031/44728_1 /ASSEMBLY_ACC=CAM_ASM_000338 /TAXON_ID=268821 /ORGANISM="Scrippsiella Hangoei, Strain SHTV-5" /LENGTH=40 /DNA_ID= /DNA_START= /DNA_END= /DNA_ORIENTATION=
MPPLSMSCKATLGGIKTARTTPAKRVSSNLTAGAELIGGK